MNEIKKSIILEILKSEYELNLTDLEITKPGYVHHVTNSRYQLVRL